MATITPIHSGLGGAIGCDYQVSRNRLVFVEYSGKLSSIDLATGAYHVLGTGYHEPEDVKLSADGSFAYVTERGGTLARVEMAHPDRTAPTTHVISAGMTAPQQIALDHDRLHAYVVEYASPGRLFRIDLATPGFPRTIVASGLHNAVGVAVSRDLSYAYVSEQTPGQVVEITLSTGHRNVIATGLVGPFFLTWADDSESALYVAERDPANRITRINLTSTPATHAVVAGGLPARPSSVAVKTAGELLACSDSVVSDVQITPYNASGPLIIGIGLIPSDKVAQVGPGLGLATTDPASALPVTAAPFGGTLPMMINHPKAQSIGAKFYKLSVDGHEPLSSFNDYFWDGTQFVLKTTSPDGGGFYPVRLPGAIWLSPWLGYWLDSTALTVGVRTITVTFFNAAHASVDSATLKVFIDNRLPTAAINMILHNGVPVAPCDSVKPTPDAFTFQIQASHPENLWSWSLVALWGDNKSKGVASGTANIAAPVPSPAWQATVAGDPSSIHCGHTFILGVWDRVTNGYGHIHYAEAHKTIDIRA